MNIQNQKKENKNGFPLWVFAGAFLLSIGFIFFSSFSEEKEHTKYKDMASRHLSLTHHIDRAIFLDEVLTMSALMVARTGDFSYENRYNQFDTELISEINLLKDAVAGQGPSTDELNNSNEMLTKVEREVFALVHQNKKKEALALISSEEYATLKKQYADGITKIKESIDDLISTEIQKLNTSSAQLETANYAAAIVLFIAWIFAFTATRKWNKERIVSESALQKAHDELENKVVERTRDLSVSALYSRSLIEASLDPLVTISTEGKITDVNKETENATGATRNELIGTDFADYFTEPEKARKGYQKVFSEGSVTDYPLTLRNRNGQTMDVLYNASVYRNQDGSVAGVFAAARDITDQKKAASELKEKEERLTLATDKNGVGIWDWNLQTQEMFWDDSMYALYHIRREDFSGTEEAWRKALHPDDLIQGDKDVEDALSGKRPFESQFRVIWPNGEVHHIKGVGKVFRNEQGVPIRMLGINVDITEQKEAEETLKKSEQGLAEAQRMAHLGSWELDLKKNILSWSEENYRIFGFENEKFDSTYEAFLETIHPDDRDFVNKAYTESVKNKTPYNIEHRLLLKDGSIKYVNERCKTFYNEKGEPIRSIGTTYDITEQKVAENELWEQEKFSQSLLRLSRALEKAQSYGETLEAARNEIKSSIGYQTVWSYLLTEDKKHFKVIAAGGPTSDLILSEEGSATLTIQGDQMLEEITKADNIVIVADAKTDPRTNKEIVEKEKIHTLINVPILLSGQHLGIVGAGTFGDEGVRVPSHSEQGYLVTLAGHMAVTFDRIRLLKEREDAEKRATRLSDLYATLSLCNQAIVHSNNKEELFTQVCRAAVDSGGFKMAWVGIGAPSTKMIIPAASYGDTTGYLANIQISIDANDPHGRGPSGTAIREGEPFWCQDFQNDPRTAPWNESGSRAGWAASAAIPIYQKGQTVGAITLYSETVNAFDEASKNLITEMATDISYALDTFADKAEKKEVESDLAEGKVQDEAIMASLGEGMIAVDKGGRVLTMNRSAEKITGRSAVDTIGMILVDAIPVVYENGDPVPKEKRPVSVVLESKVSSASETDYLVHKSGQIIPVSITTTPVILQNEMIGAVEIIRDVTSEKEIEKTREDLLALASHQLRTPLSGTKWLIETLQSGLKGPLSPEQKEYLDEIYKVNERMTTLVVDMLGVLRLESGDIQAKKDQFSTNTLLETLSETFTPVAKGKQIALRLEKDGEHTVETDPLLLRNIIESFVSNAINYSDKGDEVVVAVTATGNELIFSIKDSGIGIPKDEQARLFERFYRASNAKVFNTKGTGLGLYIAATLAKKIGAHLSFESEEGKGSTFFVHLPYSEQN